MHDKQKMLSGQVYQRDCQELMAWRTETSSQLRLFNQVSNTASQQRILHQMGVKLGDNSVIHPPLNLIYGLQLSLGANSIIHTNAMIVDNAPVHIGTGVVIGPNAQLYTVKFVLDPSKRLAGEEVALPITIADNVCIGGGAIILAGVHIGKGAEW